MQQPICEEGFAARYTAVVEPHAAALDAPATLEMAIGAVQIGSASLEMAIWTMQIGSASLKREELRTALWNQDWVVYAKPPFGGPEHVLKYLGRYTHRVAISNQRLLAVANGVVRFAYHDYADPDACKELPLPAIEFLRRFLLHVVPKGFMRIRHYGITANARRQEKLARCRELLDTTPAPPTATPLPADADTAAAPPEDITPRCPQCGASMRIIEILPPQPHDTS